MDRNRAVWSLLALSGVFGAGPAAAFKGEPDGFRGIPWTAPMAQYSHELNQIEAASGSVYFNRSGDKLELGAAHLTGITYDFYKGQFAAVLIHSAVGSNSDMIQTFEFQFGVGDKPNRYLDQYYWDGPKAFIALTCSDVTEKCTALIESKLMRAVEDADKINAAAGAKKDF